MSGRMRTSIMIGGAVVMICFGLTLLEKRDTNEFALDPAQNPDGQQVTAEEANRANDLAKKRSLVGRRIEFSRRIAQELIARQVTLGDAAAQLQTLDHRSAPLCREFYESIFPAIYPGRSDYERYCRRAMALVDSELAGEPAKRGVALQSLDQEFRRKFTSEASQTFY